MRSINKQRNGKHWVFFKSYPLSVSSMGARLQYFFLVSFSLKSSKKKKKDQKYKFLNPWIETSVMAFPFPNEKASVSKRGFDEEMPENYFFGSGLKAPLQKELPTARSKFGQPRTLNTPPKNWTSRGTRFGKHPSLFGYHLKFIDRPPLSVCSEPFSAMTFSIGVGAREETVFFVSEGR